MKALSYLIAVPVVVAFVVATAIFMVLSAMMHIVLWSVESTYKLVTQ